MRRWLLLAIAGVLVAVVATLLALTALLLDPESAQAQAVACPI